MCFFFLVNLVALERNLKKLLKGKQNGIFATRLRPEYVKMFGENLPDDLKSIVINKFNHFIEIQRYIYFETFYTPFFQCQKTNSDLKYKQMMLLLSR